MRTPLTLYRFHWLNDTIICFPHGKDFWYSQTDLLRILLIKEPAFFSSLVDYGAHKNILFDTEKGAFGLSFVRGDQIWEAINRGCKPRSWHIYDLKRHIWAFEDEFRGVFRDVYV